MTPLFVSGKTLDGTPLMAGLYTAKATHGLPLSLSYDLCKEKGFTPDWAEYLADAGRHNSLSSAVAELELLIGKEAFDKVYRGFCFWCDAVNTPLNERCQQLWQTKQANKII